jgi:hypothetical protein
VTGVTAIEGKERGLVSCEFVAVTLNVYALPFIKPVTLAVVAVPAFTVGLASAPKYGITVYLIIAEDPGVLEGFHLTVADAFSGSAIISVGAEGATGGAVSVLLSKPSAVAVKLFSFVTIRRNLYSVPYSKLLTVALVEVPGTSTSLSEGVPPNTFTEYYEIGEAPTG